MTNSLFIAVLAGLGGMLGWGFADFFAKKTIDRIGEIASLVWAHFFGTLVFILFAATQFLINGNHLDIPSTGGTWLKLVFFGVLQMIVYWLVYKGFSKGQLAVLNPVFASYSGLVALFSVIFFGEVLTPLLVAALLIVFAGILMLNIDFKSLRKQKKLVASPGLSEVGLAAVLAAGWTLGWDRFISGQSYLTFALFMYLFMTIAALMLAKIMRVKLNGPKAGVWHFLMFIGLGEAIAYLSISIGFSKTSYVSIVALISGSFSLVTVVLAHAFLKERISTLQKVAVGVIVFGIAVVSLS